MSPSQHLNGKLTLKQPLKCPKLAKKRKKRLMALPSMVGKPGIRPEFYLFSVAGNQVSFWWQSSIRPKERPKKRRKN
jgi:hypothetical protein